VDVGKYLAHYGREVVEVKDRGEKGIWYNLVKCEFEPNHGSREAAIIQKPDGSLGYSCYHDSCTDRTWQQARFLISGTDSLAPFMEGYDPSWSRSGSGSGKGQSPGRASSKDRPYLSFSEKGRAQFNAAIMGGWLEERYWPIYSEGRDFGNQLWRYGTDGYWKFFPDAVVRKRILLELEDYAKQHWIGEAVDMLKDQVFVSPEELEADPMWINVGNGMLHVETQELVPHAPSFYSRTQLPVSYEPGAECNLWKEALAGIFKDDLEKVKVLQQFFGYCLYPRVIFPAALFQIGQGRNGKGTVETVLYSMLGEGNVSHIGLARMSKDFGPIEIKDKLLNSCGETETKALDVTNFKKIATGDRIQAEVKYKPDAIFRPIAKHMISMNAFPGIRDKTDAFFRRIIVMEYRQKFEGDDDDPFLADKLQNELDGIFLWALEGLRQVLAVNRIEVPESVMAAKRRFRTKVNPVLAFVDEECCEGKQYAVSPPSLYKAYKAWCEEGGMQPMGKLNFYEQIQTNLAVIKKRQGSKDVFMGVGLLEGEDEIPF
jgi:putative DNA primase/helicase